jgi:hypothetical protein
LRNLYQARCRIFCIGVVRLQVETGAARATC